MAADPHQISEHEHGLVRLFTSAMEPEVDAAITAQNVHKLLGDEIALDPEKVEVFPSKVIAGLGLSRYLSEGYGIAENELSGKSAALDALTGLIVIVPSSAFTIKPQTLNPNAALRFIGVFEEQKGEIAGSMSKPDTAKGQVKPPEATTFNPAPRARYYSWLIALGALIVAATLVLFATF